MILNSKLKNKGTIVPVHVMKTDTVSRGTAPVIHNLSNGEKKVVSLVP